MRPPPCRRYSPLPDRHRDLPRLRFGGLGQDQRQHAKLQPSLDLGKVVLGTDRVLATEPAALTLIHGHRHEPPLGSDAEFFRPDAWQRQRDHRTVFMFLDVNAVPDGTSMPLPKRRSTSGSTANGLRAEKGSKVLRYMGIPPDPMGCMAATLAPPSHHGKASGVPFVVCRLCRAMIFQSVGMTADRAELTAATRVVVRIPGYPFPE